MRFELTTNISVVNPSANLDDRYGPHMTLQDAYTHNPRVLRVAGKTFGLIENGKVVEYWWESDDAIEDGDEVKKNEGGIANIFIDYNDITELLTNQNNQNKDTIYVVADATADNRFTFPDSADAKIAYYRYNGSATANLENDYSVISTPFALNEYQKDNLDGKEDKANKATDFSVVSNTLYPTVKAVDDRIKSIDSTIENDITSDVEVGGIEPGNVVPEGTSLTDFVKQLLFKTYNPSFAPPTYSLSISITGTREVGAEFNVDLEGNFNRGSINGKLVDGVWKPNTKQADRAGVPSEYKFEGETNGLSNTKTIPNYKTVLGSNSFQSQVLYEKGPQPKNSKGDNYSTPLPEGSISATASYTGALRRFFGAGSESVNPRTLSSIFDTTNISQTFDINTGTTHRFFHLYIPVSRELERVELVEASNAVITSQYVLQGIVQVPDASEDLRDYRYYRMEADEPYYDQPVTHRIKIKNV